MLSGILFCRDRRFRYRRWRTHHDTGHARRWSPGSLYYGQVMSEPKAAEPVVKVPFLVKVSISDLNIRKGPGTNFERVRFIEPGVFTIVQTSSGAGASMWGKLKSGIGWVSLDFVRRL